MKQVFHIVGWQGTGKSKLAALMIEALADRGGKCAAVDSETMARTYKGDAVRATADHVAVGVDYLFLEYYPDHFQRALPGDRIIRIEDVPAVAETAQGGV